MEGVEVQRSLRGEATLRRWFAKAAQMGTEENIRNLYFPPQCQQMEPDIIFAGTCHLSTWMTEKAERDSLPYSPSSPSTTSSFLAGDKHRGYQLLRARSENHPWLWKTMMPKPSSFSCSAGHGETHVVSMLGLVPSAGGSLTCISRSRPRVGIVPQSREDSARWRGGG